MNHIIKPASITLMGLVGIIATTLCCHQATAGLVIKNVTEAKSKAGQSCFSENNDFVAIYCNCSKQEFISSSDNLNNCTDGNYNMGIGGWCSLPGGGDGIGDAYCAHVPSTGDACTYDFCGCNTPQYTDISNRLYTEAAYSPYVYYYYEYNLSTTRNAYKCDSTRTKKYTCAQGEYAYSYDSSRNNAIEECTPCPGLTGTDGYNHATTDFPNAGTITSCYAPAGTYKDKTGIFKFSQDCYYKK